MIRKDLTGQRFGKLLVIGTEKIFVRNRNRTYNKCLCDCGNERLVDSKFLKSGQTINCGFCLRSEDITGQKFGKITVVKFLKMDENYNAKWLCQCDCGTIFETYGSSLKNGGSKSCGCSNKGNSLPIGESIFNRIYDNYRKSAKARGMIFEISKEVFKIITSKNCHYCNKPPIPRFYKMCEKSGTIYCHGLDRVDNNIGYIEENVVSCCEQCNRAKLNYKLEDFLVLVKNIYENLKLDKYGEEEKTE